MIRRIQMSVNESNTGKLSLLDRMMAESLRVMNEYINQLWDSKERFNKFADVAVDTWLSARMKQCLLKQSVEAMKSHGMVTIKQQASISFVKVGRSYNVGDSRSFLGEIPNSAIIF